MKRRFYLTIISGMFALLIFVFPPGANGLDAAATCKNCHIKIYNQWISSLHATSFTEPKFRTVFDKINKVSPAKGAFCANCHAPSASMSENLRGDGPIEPEGVTCDFCHTVKEVNLTGDFPKYVNTPGTKRGPIENAKSPYHNTVFSPLMLESKFCSGCHEYTNQHGVGIITTWSEWKESYYKGKGIHCQYCHLPQLYKDTKYLTVSERENDPPDHLMKGGHYPELLRETLQISGVMKIENDEAAVELKLLNNKSGHNLPTGLPTHRIAIATALYDKEEKKIAERVVFLERILGDEQGEPITDLGDIFFKSKNVIKDNRLKPKEKRKLRIKLPLKEIDTNISAIVSLFYEIMAPDASLKRERINFSNVAIPLYKGKFPFVPIIVLFILIIICVIAYDIFIGKSPRQN